MTRRALFIVWVMVGCVLVSPGSNAYDIIDLAPDTVTTMQDGRVLDVCCWGNDVYWISGTYNETTSLMENCAVNKDGGGKVSDIAYSSAKLDASGNTVVWEDVDGSDSNIYYSVGSGRRLLVGTENSETSPRISGSRVVFQDEAGLGYVNVGDSTVGRVPDSAYCEMQDVSGDYIAYVVTGDLFLYDIGSGDTTMLIYNAGIADLAISGDNIVYAQLTNFGNSVSIVLYNITTEQSKVIGTEGSGDVEIDGNFAVWAGFIYDIRAQAVKQITGEAQNCLDTGGSRIAWFTVDTDVSPFKYEVLAADQPEPGAAPDDGSDDELPDDYHWLAVDFSIAGTTEELAVDDGVSFYIGEEEHGVAVTGVNSTGATLKVFSAPTVVNLNVGQTRTLEGMEITLDSVDAAAQTATLTIKKTADTDSAIEFPSMLVIVIIVIIAAAVFGIYGYLKRR